MSHSSFLFHTVPHEVEDDAGVVGVPDGVGDAHADALEGMRREGDLCHTWRDGSAVHLAGGARRGRALCVVLRETRCWKTVERPARVYASLTSGCWMVEYQ